MWYEVEDEQGRTYFWQESTNIVQWSPPRSKRKNVYVANSMIDKLWRDLQNKEGDIHDFVKIHQTYRIGVCLLNIAHAQLLSVFLRWIRVSFMTSKYTLYYKWKQRYISQLDMCRKAAHAFHVDDMTKKRVLMSCAANLVDGMLRHVLHKWACVTKEFVYHAKLFQCMYDSLSHRNMIQDFVYVFNKWKYFMFDGRIKDSMNALKCEHANIISELVNAKMQCAILQTQKSCTRKDFIK